MFIGHGLLAFALVAFAAHALGWPRDRALTLAVAAGAFGLAPDVDMLYAPAGVIGASGVFDAAGDFWATGNLVHRAVTHSLVVAVGATAALWTYGRARAAGVLGGGGLVAWAYLASGGLAAAVMLVFLATVFTIAGGALHAGRAAGLRERHVLAAALFGIASHPFGDLLTGEPPALLYPLDVTLVAARPALFVDPTLNLLAPLFVELATAWLALAAYLRLHERRLLPEVSGRALLGTGYASAVLLMPPPTLEVSYHFVFSILGLGVVTSTPRMRALRRPLRAVATGLAAVTLAALAYTGAYLWV